MTFAIHLARKNFRRPDHRKIMARALVDIDSHHVAEVLPIYAKQKIPILNIQTFNKINEKINVFCCL